MIKAIIESPWIIEVIGGSISGITVGLLLNYIAQRQKSKGDSTFIVQVIQVLGYIILAPFFVLFFVISVPLFAMLFLTESAGGCRYKPTCKEYLIEAIRVHGLSKGIFMGVSRVLRCNPFPRIGGHGYDPVPPKNEVTEVEN